MSGGGYLGRLDEFDPEVESWECYMERCDQFFTANDVKDDKKQVAVILTCMGGKTYSELRDAVAPVPPKGLKLSEINQALTARYCPESTLILNRYRVHACKQKPGEGIAQFASNLRRLASKGDYGGFLNQALRDQFVCGLSDSATQRKLLGMDKLDYDTAVKTALAMESAQKDCKELTNSMKATTIVNQVRDNSELTCYCCGVKGHVKPDCSLRDKKCDNCGRPGHVAKLCRKKKSEGAKSENRKPKSRFKKRNKHAKTAQVSVQENQSESDSDTFRLSSSEVSEEPIYVTVNIENIPIRMEVDTAARRSIIGEHDYKCLGENKPKLETTETVLRAYGGSIVKPLGQINASVAHFGQSMELPLLVAPGSSETLLGRDWLS